MKKIINLPRFEMAAAAVFHNRHEFSKQTNVMTNKKRQQNFFIRGCITTFAALLVCGNGVDNNGHNEVNAAREVVSANTRLLFLQTALAVVIGDGDDVGCDVVVLIVVVVLVLVVLVLLKFLLFLAGILLCSLKHAICAAVSVSVPVGVCVIVVVYFAVTAIFALLLSFISVAL